MGWSSSRIWWIRAARAARSRGALAAMAAGEEGSDEVARLSIVRPGGGAGLCRCDGRGEPVVRGEPLRFCDVSTRVLSVEALRRVKLVEAGRVVMPEQQAPEIVVGGGIVGGELGELPIRGLGGCWIVQAARGDAPELVVLSRMHISAPTR